MNAQMPRSRPKRSETRRQLGRQKTKLGLNLGRSTKSLTSQSAALMHEVQQIQSKSGDDLLAIESPMDEMRQMLVVSIFKEYAKQRRVKSETQMKPDSDKMSHDKTTFDDFLQEHCIRCSSGTSITEALQLMEKIKDADAKELDQGESSLARSMIKEEEEEEDEEFLTLAL